MMILSHRGYWRAPGEKNTPEAFTRSFSLGFGTETDVRDCAGRLVMSHDPPLGQEMSFADFLELHRRHDPSLPLAINIKADGLQRLTLAALERYRPTDWFVFDMSIPDTRGWLAAGLPVFVRHSDIERQPWFYEAAAGIWLDGFHGDWMMEQDIVAHLNAGKRVCIVSSELHGRDPAALWSRLSASTCVGDKRVMLCTDRPEDARAFFGGR